MKSLKLIVIMSVMAFISGCSQKLDGTNAGTLVTSMKKMQEKLPPGEAAMLDRDFSILLQNISTFKLTSMNFDGMTFPEFHAAIANASNEQTRLGIENEKKSYAAMLARLEKYKKLKAAFAKVELGKPACTIENGEGALIIPIKNNSEFSIKSFRHGEHANEEYLEAPLPPNQSTIIKIKNRYSQENCISTETSPSEANTFATFFQIINPEFGIGKDDNNFMLYISDSADPPYMTSEEVHLRNIAAREESIINNDPKVLTLKIRH